jgi:hypothetical protein
MKKLKTITNMLQELGDLKKNVILYKAIHAKERKQLLWSVEA